MSKFGYDAVKHADSRRKGRVTQGFAVFRFEGEMLTRAQIADRVGRSLSNTGTLIQKLRKAGIRELKREHFE